MPDSHDLPDPLLPDQPDSHTPDVPTEETDPVVRPTAVPMGPHQTESSRLLVIGLIILTGLVPCMVVLNFLNSLRKIAANYPQDLWKYTVQLGMNPLISVSILVILGWLAFLLIKMSQWQLARQRNRTTKSARRMPVVVTTIVVWLGVTLLLMVVGAWIVTKFSEKGHSEAALSLFFGNPLVYVIVLVIAGLAAYVIVKLLQDCAARPTPNVWIDENPKSTVGESPSVAESTSAPMLIELRVWPGFLLSFLIIATILVANYWIGVQVGLSYRGSTGMYMCFFFSISATLAIILAATAIAVALSPVPRIERLRLGASSASLGQLLVTVVAVFGLNLIAVGILTSGLLPEVKPIVDLSLLITSLSSQNFVIFLLAIGPVTAIAEECLFRGYLQTRFSQRWGPLVGILVTSCIFAVFHLNLIQGVITFFLGLYFGFLAERFDSIRPSIVCHAIYNVVLICLIRTQPDFGPTTSLVAFLFGMSVFSVGALYLVGSMPQADRSVKRRTKSAPKIELPEAPPLDFDSLRPDDKESSQPHPIDVSEIVIDP